MIRIGHDGPIFTHIENIMIIAVTFMIDTFISSSYLTFVLRTTFYLF